MAAKQGPDKCPVDLGMVKEIARQHKDVAELKLFQELDEKLVLEVINKGDVNFNFSCKVKDGSDAVFVKYSPPFCKSAPEIKLPANRLSTEYTTMCYCHKAHPGSVPRPLCYSEVHNVAMFEFLDGFEDYEELIVKGKVSRQTVQYLAKSLGKFHQSTHKTQLSGDEFNALKDKFKNSDLDDTIGDYYFDTSFYSEEEIAKLKPELVKDSEQFRADPTIRPLLTEVRGYLSREECLIHNDLHLMSVMVKDDVPKMIDFEFSGMGNPARDIAVVLASYLALHYFHMLNPQDNGEKRRFAYKLQEACDTFMSTYYDHMTSYTEPEAEYKKEMARQISGLVGVELCSRVLSATHYPSIQNANHVIDAEKEILQCGLRLLKKHRQIDTVGKMVFIGLMLC